MNPLKQALLELAYMIIFILGLLLGPVMLVMGFIVLFSSFFVLIFTGIGWDFIITFLIAALMYIISRVVIMQGNKGSFLEKKLGKYFS